MWFLLGWFAVAFVVAIAFGITARRGNVPLERELVSRGHSGKQRTADI